MSEKESTGQAAAAAASPPPGASREGAGARGGGTRGGEGAGRGAPWDRGGLAVSQPLRSGYPCRKVSHPCRLTAGSLPARPSSLGQPHRRPRSALCSKMEREKEEKPTALLCLEPP